MSLEWSPEGPASSSLLTGADAGADVQYLEDADSAPQGPPPDGPPGVPGLPPEWRPAPELLAMYGIEPEPDVHATAAAGVAGAGGPLPHLAAVQHAFGDAHDLGAVQAHVGGAAADAAAAIGADAYATGNHVAFADAPTLFVAAHEAAHVVHQRAGVSLHGGVGQAGDPHEQHADAIAARVVAGQSAADLLGAPRGAAGAGGVQRKASPDHGVDAVPQASLSLTIAKKLPDVSLEATLKLDPGSDGYKHGKVKGLSPEVKVVAMKDQIALKLATKLASINLFESTIAGLKLSIDAELVGFETGAKLEGDKLASSTELALAAISVKVSGDLTEWLAGNGIDVAPYHVKIEGKVKLKLTAADAEKLLKLLARKAELEALRDQAEGAGALTRDALRRQAELEAELEAKSTRLAKLEKRTGYSAEREAVRERVAELRETLAGTKTEVEAYRKEERHIAAQIKKVAQEVVELEEKVEATAAKQLARRTTRAAGKVIGKALGHLSFAMVVQDVIDVLFAFTALALDAASFHFGGGGSAARRGGEHSDSDGDDPDGTAYTGRAHEDEDGDAPDGTQGHAPKGAEDHAPKKATAEAPHGDQSGKDIVVEGDGTGLETTPEGGETGRATAADESAGVLPGEGATSTCEVDATDLTRGASEGGDRAALGNDAQAKQIVEALGHRGVAAPDAVARYLELLVPPGWTDAQTARLLDELAAWLDDPVHQAVAASDDALVEVEVEALIAAIEQAGAERDAAAAQPTARQAKPAAGDSHDHDGGHKAKPHHASGDAAHAGKRAAKHEARGRAHHDNNAGDPELESGKLTIPTSLIEQWIEVDRSGNLIQTAAVAEWLKERGPTFTTTIDGERYHATGITVLGHEAGAGEYAGTVTLEMRNQAHTQAWFGFSFTYRPDAAAGQRFLAPEHVDVTPLEQVAYRADDGRPSIGAGTTVDLGPFEVEVQRAVSLAPVASGTADPVSIYLVLVIGKVHDKEIARWRGVDVREGAIIEGEFALRLLGQPA